MTAELSARRIAAMAQLSASDPAASAWVGASAGSGKTKVLTDRVLRLLLQEGQAPGRILCLTFTRAAAAEMQTRLARRLGAWAAAEEAALAADLAALGCTPTPAVLRRARLLFAEVLELPGGMRISTIHSFCQSLLGAFPLEAGLPPQFAVLEDADAAALLAEAREAVLGGGLAPRERLDTLAALTGAEEFSAVVAALLRRRDRLAACLAGSNGPAGLGMRLAALLGLGEGEGADAIRAEACRIPEAVAREAAAWANHRLKQPRETAAKIRAFLAEDPEGRAARWEEWRSLFLTDKGEPRKFLADSAAMAAEAERIQAVGDKLAAARLLEATETLLALAGPVLDHYEARKRSAGLLAYDDLIAMASRVLRDPGSAWVLFKLDGGLDHVLLDEAQDTNPAQWEIASALTEEFFSGFGAERAGSGYGAGRGERGLRTIFAVGDVKQAIYGFQGADARGFAAWEDRFRRRAAGRGGGDAFRRVEMTVSFRSTAPVLALVDAVFAEGAARAGVVEGDAVLEHRPDRLGHAGAVELWPLLRPAETPKPEPWEVPEQPERVADGTALMAEALAARIAAMTAGETLPARARRIRPGDILVLVRRLANVELVPMLVRALKERGIPVAGVGRQTLIEHIAVMDLLALLDVLLLPEDDLQLAALLRSPLVGLSEEALFGLAHGRTGSLWARLLPHRGAEGTARSAAQGTALGAAAEWIGRLAERADLVTPHALLAEVLGEPSVPGGAGGRARLLARLGPDAAEPLDELLHAALSYEKRHPPSLQGFVHWLRRGGAEVKREAESGADAVRIMTVHNAKGLQAPVVILPDVGSGEPRETLRWTAAGDGEPALPLWAPRKAFHAPAWRAAADADARQRLEEENRLLYVALTRAEDRLLVCGWGKEPRAWYASVAAGFRRLEGAREEGFDPAAFGAPPACDFGGGRLWRLACAQEAPPVEDRAATAPGAREAALPDWALRPAPPEAPEAAITPSALPGEQETPAAAPHGAGDPGGRRFRRGRLVHALLQHLPDHAPAARAAAGRRFLARPGHGLDPAEQAAVLEEVLALIESPAIAEAFGPGSLAEAPLAGRIGGRLVAGQVDRLVVGAARILVLDYKTNRPPPETAEAVAPLYLRQMAAYRAVLRQAFPGREVACALVWTHGPRLMPLPDALLDRHAPG